MTTTEETTMPTLTASLRPTPDLERTAEQVRRLFALLDGWGNDRARELAAWAALQIDTGCRPSELAALRWDDLGAPCWVARDEDRRRAVRFARIRLGGRTVELRRPDEGYVRVAERGRLPHSRVCIVSEHCAALVAEHRRAATDCLVPLSGRDRVFRSTPYAVRHALAELTGDPAFRLKWLAQAWADLLLSASVYGSREAMLDYLIPKSVGLLSQQASHRERYFTSTVQGADVLDAVMAPPSEPDPIDASPALSGSTP